MFWIAYDFDFVPAVAQYEDIQMFCICIHDSLTTDALESDEELTINVLAAISFIVIKGKNNARVCYILYHRRLNYISFHDIVPTYSTMTDLRCPV